MLCDLSTILNNDGAALSLSGTVDIGNALGDDVSFSEGVLVSGEIVCRGNVLELNAHVEGKFKTPCARCLKELSLPLSFDFAETLAQDSDAVTDKDSIIVFVGNTIDLSEIVIGNLLLNLSYKYLCSEDCKGICQKCGADLNKGDCGCENDEIDPRWEKLKNFK